MGTFSYLTGTVPNSRTLAGEPTRILDSRQHSVGVPGGKRRKKAFGHGDRVAVGEREEMEEERGRWTKRGRGRLQ